MANQLILNTKAEWLKTRKTSAWWFTICAAGFLPAINILILLNRPDYFVAQLEKDSWSQLFTMVWRNVAAIILPVFVIMINNIVVQIEYRNNTWKQVYASPRSYADIFFSRFLIIHGYMVGFFLLSFIFMLGAGALVGTINSQYHFLHQPLSLSIIFKKLAWVYIGILGVSAIQYWLSMRFRNFTIPLGIGIALWITGIIIADWEKIAYYPYMYSILLYTQDMPGKRPSLDLLLTNSILCFILAIIAGFFDIRMRKERG